MRQAILKSMLFALVANSAPVSGQESQKQTFDFEEVPRNEPNDGLSMKLNQSMIYGSNGILEIDSNFSMEKNSNLLYMDLSKLFETPTTQQHKLRRDIKRFKKQQQAEQKKQDAKRFGSSSHRLGIDAQTTLQFINDRIYHGGLFFGSNGEEVQCIFDTATDMLVVQSKDCRNCNEQVYDYETSNRYAQMTIAKTQRLYYQSRIHVVGNIAKDEICLSKGDNCVDPFQFLMVYDQWGMPDEVGGVLGLTLGGEPKIPMNSPEFKVGDLYVDFLRMAGQITEKKFSTHLEDDIGSSFVDFGPPRLANMSSEDEGVQLLFESGYFWNTLITGVRFGPMEEGRDFSLDQEYMMLSSGSAFSYVPKSRSHDFFNNIFKQRRIDYKLEQGMFVVDCRYQMDAVFFMINKSWVEIASKDMIIDISKYNDGSLCVLSFVPSQDEIWVLGQALYKDYYMIHDPDAKAITFVPTEKKAKSPLGQALIPVVKFNANYDWVMLLIKIAAYGLVSVMTWVFIQFVIDNQPGIAFLDATSRSKYIKQQEAEKRQSRPLDKDTVNQLIVALQKHQQADQTTNQMQ